MIVFMIIIHGDSNTHSESFVPGTLSNLLIDSLKPFQPAEGDTVITTHSTEKRLTPSRKLC